MQRVVGSPLHKDICFFEEQHAAPFVREVEEVFKVAVDVEDAVAEFAWGVS